MVTGGDEVVRVWGRGRVVVGVPFGEGEWDGWTVWEALGCVAGVCLAGGRVRCGGCLVADSAMRDVGRLQRLSTALTEHVRMVEAQMVQRGMRSAEAATVVLLPVAQCGEVAGQTSR